MRKHNMGDKERGVALLIALFALLLISAVGLGMVYMSNTETSVNANYKDTQSAFFSMRGGLEEMRDRMRSNSGAAITLPTVMPGAANSIVYITNPSGGGDVVDPKTFGNTYFDDEFCHESFAGSGVTYVAPGTPCPAAGAPPGVSVAPYVASTSPYTNTASSLKYKWVRITLKENGTFPSAVVDASQAASSQVCWNSSTFQEVAVTALGQPTCAAAANAGLYVEPVYLVTSMAITPQGSRRVGQYEAAPLNITPPPAGLILNGNTPSFGTPHSNNAGIDGHDGSGSPPAVPGCTTTGAALPAIGTGNAADAASVPPQIFRPANFVGSGPSPSVVNDSSALTQWSTPAQLNTLVSALANSADYSYSCGIGGAGCSGSYGTTTSPQITFINGDVSLGGGAGVLIVTGTLTISGVMQFNGLILVIGQGKVVINGGGNGTIYGEILAAQTNSSVAPYAQLAAFPIPSPSFTWNGGGRSHMYYNSCWADIGNTLHYMVIASREEMY
jgi:Tfp pilus assembly protein PilV